MFTLLSNPSGVRLSYYETEENALRKMRNAIVIMDYEVVSSYGMRIYSKINVACPGCKAIMLCDQDHRGLIKRVCKNFDNLQVS